MFAIIKTGGKQYIVSPGDKIKVEKLKTPESEEVVFDSVLLFFDKEIQIGAPYVKDYIVNGRVLKQSKGDKIIVYKYKAKKRYHKKQGHRQLFSEVEILSIGNRAELDSSLVQRDKNMAESKEVKKIAKKTKPVLRQAQDKPAPEKKKISATKKTKTSAKKTAKAKY
ncbi:MAG: 50S ribosomal protein L21 [Candidatus Colwellbacteria bacterium]|nr:50S ribosomal protein L21 [Candidatus Colwellbacteria bacterium]